METQEADGLPDIVLWDIARSLGRLESYAEPRNDRTGRTDSRIDRMEARLDRIDAKLDRLFLAVLGIGTALIGGFTTVLVKLFAG